jgi:two-component system chemotaxis response regulator CheY
MRLKKLFPPAAPETMHRKLKCLVVDDDAGARLTMAKMLEPYGQVDQAENGLQALASFREALLHGTPYHLVTLDVMMPELDGVVTLECLRGLEYVHRSRLRAKILVLSGVDDKNFILTTAKRGSDGYLLKPVESSGLAERMRELFQISSRPPGASDEAAE